VHHLHLAASCECELLPALDRADNYLGIDEASKEEEGATAETKNILRSLLQEREDSVRSPALTKEEKSSLSRDGFEETYWTFKKREAECLKKKEVELVGLSGEEGGVVGRMSSRQQHQSGTSSRHRRREQQQQQQQQSRGTQQQQQQQQSVREEARTAQLPPGMYNKKFSMDSDYREYYRDRPRGEFLTRGAALSSQQPPPAAHRDFPGEQRRYAGGQGGGQQAQQQGGGQQGSRIGRNLSSEKLGGGGQENLRRNPTILRKKLDVCVYLMSAVAIQMEVEEGANATVTDLVSSLLEEEELGLPRATQDILSLWMNSPLLEVQLKPHHKPFFIRREWNHFLQRFSSAPQNLKALDEPVLSLQRNVFCSKREEQGVKDHKVLELLYEEAKYNMLTSRYPCEISDYIMLGGIQARLEIGPYDMAVHTPAFFRQNLSRFLPEHAVRKTNGILSWLPWSASAKTSPEARLIDQFKAIPSNASPKRLVKKYLEFCWSLPYYGSAFFRGQIETPAKSLTSLVINQDSEVLIAINSQGLYVIDPINVVVLLGLKFEELSWDYAKPSQENNEDCLPCLFIQFCVIENGRRVSKILQVFSRQAVQMDALISAFVDEIKQRAAMYAEDGDGNIYNDNSSTEADDCLVPLTTVSRRGIPESCLSNKLSRLTLATFDDEGHCIGHMGSWSFSS